MHAHDFLKSFQFFSGPIFYERRLFAEIKKKCAHTQTHLYKQAEYTRDKPFSVFYCEVPCFDMIATNSFHVNDNIVVLHRLCVFFLFT